MQSSLADAATARLQLERHRDVPGHPEQPRAKSKREETRRERERSSPGLRLAAARSSRSSERSQLEAELADAQQAKQSCPVVFRWPPMLTNIQCLCQALVQLQTDIATETSCLMLKLQAF